MTTTYFLRDANADTTCDAGATTGDYDMTKTTTAAEFGHTSDVAGITSFQEMQTYDVEVSGDNPSTGSHTLNVVISALTNADVRVRVQEIAAPAGCGVLNSSSYSSTYSASGTITDSLSLTWSTGTRLRLSIEGKEQTGSMGRRTFEIEVETGLSYVTAPWTDVANIYTLAQMGVGH